MQVNSENGQAASILKPAKGIYMPTHKATKHSQFSFELVLHDRQHQTWRCLCQNTSQMSHLMRLKSQLISEPWNSASDMK